MNPTNNMKNVPQPYASVRPEAMPEGLRGIACALLLCRCVPSVLWHNMHEAPAAARRRGHRAYAAWQEVVGDARKASRAGVRVHARSQPNDEPPGVRLPGAEDYACAEVWGFVLSGPPSVEALEWLLPLMLEPDDPPGQSSVDYFFRSVGASCLGDLSGQQRHELFIYVLELDGYLDGGMLDVLRTAVGLPAFAASPLGRQAAQTDTTAGGKE